VHYGKVASERGALRPAGSPYYPDRRRLLGKYKTEEFDRRRQIMEFRCRSGHNALRYHLSTIRIGNVDSICDWCTSGARQDAWHILLHCKGWASEGDKEELERKRRSVKRIATFSKWQDFIFSADKTEHAYFMGLLDVYIRNGRQL